MASPSLSLSSDTLEKTIELTDKQIEFLEASEEFPVVFYGGAKGGGKSYGLRNIILVLALQTPRLDCAIFRRTYEELEANHIRRLFAEHPELKPFYHKTEHLLTLPNGSTIEFCHCRHESDLDIYQGREFDVLAIDEVGQWPESMFQTLRGSNRTSKPGIQPRTLLTGNPGGIGHQWLKRIFVERRFNERERPEDYHFIQAQVYDCPPLLDNDPDYVSRLEAEPNEALRKAYLLGDWDIFAGQFFSEWRRDVHVLPADFPIQPHWVRFGAYDPGYFHPAAFGWFAVDEDGKVYLYRELVIRGKRPDQIAQLVAQYEDSRIIKTIHAGPDSFAKGVDGGPSIAEQFSKLPPPYRLTLVRANNDRIQGAAHVRAFLAWQDLPEGMEGPRFFVLANCQRAINCLPRLIHDDKRPEDVLKVDASEEDPFCGDDPYDMIRYGLMSRPRPTRREPEFRIKSYDERVRDWKKKRISRFMARKQGAGFDPTLGRHW